MEKVAIYNLESLKELGSLVGIKILANEDEDQPGYWWNIWRIGDTISIAYTSRYTLDMAIFESIKELENIGLIKIVSIVINETEPGGGVEFYQMKDPRIEIAHHPYEGWRFNKAIVVIRPVRVWLWKMAKLVGLVRSPHPYSSSRVAA